MSGRDNRCAPPNQCTASVCTAAPYLESSPPSLPFIDACAAGSRMSALLSSTGASPRDDGHAASPIAIPFAFDFFGAPETQIWPDTNGYAVFGSMPPRDLVGGPAAIPELNEGPMVAPLFEDLIIPASPSGDLCWAVVGTAPDRKLAIEWLGAQAYGASMQSASHLTFEVVLSETTNTVDFIYQTLASAAEDVSYANGQEAAIELQSDAGAHYGAHMGPVLSGQALRFSPR
jgi:hypothetical protein